MPGSIRALLDLELLKEAEHKLGGRATRAMAATRPDGPAARALGEIDAAPAARVMGLAVPVLLELSSARGTADMAAPDVTPLVSGAGALLPLPRPEHLRRFLGGTPCDLDGRRAQFLLLRSTLYTKSF